jgi:hypothetical protein
MNEQMDDTCTDVIGRRMLRSTPMSQVIPKKWNICTPTVSLKTKEPPHRSFRRVNVSNDMQLGSVPAQAELQPAVISWPSKQ